MCISSVEHCNRLRYRRIYISVTRASRHRQSSTAYNDIIVIQATRCNRMVANYLLVYIGSNHDISMLYPLARHFIRIASVNSAVKLVPGGGNLVKGVQCYELFGGIAHENHAFEKKPSSGYELSFGTSLAKVGRDDLKVFYVSKKSDQLNFI